MLIAMIRENKNNYYVNLEKENNTYYYNVVCINNESISYMNDQAISELFKRIFTSNLSFLEKEGEYNVYLDEANNKRFFKGNEENYFLFFEKNGTPEILFIGYLDDNNQDEMKNFVIKSGKNKIFMKATTTLCTILYLSILGITIEDGYHYVNNYLHENILPEESTKVTVEEIQQNIINSDDKALSEERKNYLANTNLLNDVIEIADTSRNYSLRKKTENINLSCYSALEKILYPNTGGYYRFLDINTVHVVDNSAESFYQNALHEFIHVLQDENQYSYIREASAEIIKAEYYNEPAIAYPDLRQRLYVLMEMIGPQPVMECNFKGDTSTFEEAIYKHLSLEDATELLSLFTRSPSVFRNMENANKKIDTLLAKMYKNITGDDISNDRFINYIYSNGGVINRIYFNQNLIQFYEGTTVTAGISPDSYTKIDYKKAKEAGIISKYTYIEEKEISESEYKEFIINGSSFVKVSYTPIEGYHMRTKYEVESDDRTKKYNLEDALSKSLISETKYTKYEEHQYNSLEELHDEIADDSNGYIRILFKNGKTGSFQEYDNSIHMTENKEEFIFEKSIAYKFPSQVKKQISSSYNDKNSSEINAMVRAYQNMDPGKIISRNNAKK